MVNQQVDPLKDLKDIQLPLEPSWWPLAPGWWILMLLTLLMIFVAVYFYRKRKQAVKTHAYKEWQSYINTPPREQLLKTRSLIRRIAQKKFSIPMGDNSQLWQQWLTEQNLQSVFEQQQNIWSKQSIDNQHAQDCYQKTGLWIRSLK